MKKVHILLVEDNEGDIVLTVETFKDMKLNNTWEVARDGEQALRVLRNPLPESSYGLPDLILLDINLPRIDGKEFLHQVKKDPVLRKIPVMMLTTSSAQKDIEECLSLKANGYIIKPLDIQKFTEGLLHIPGIQLSLVTE